MRRHRLTVCIFSPTNLAAMRPRTSTVVTTILWLGFLVGLLDICAAFIQVSIRFPGRNPLGVLRYIASAVYGKERASAGDSMMVAGALFHFIIAYSFTIVFVLAYPHLRWLSRNRWLTGIGYGLVIWAVMNLLVVPLTRIGRLPLRLPGAVIAASILILAMGLPLSFLTYRLYHKRTAAGRRSMATAG